MRSQILADGRKMLRGFASAPDARRHAQALYTELARGEDWSKAEEERIIAFGLWLQSRPALAELKPRCEHLLQQLA